LGPFYSDGQVKWIEVLSEAGQPLTIISPWKSPVVYKSAAGERILKGKSFTVETKPGELLLFTPAKQKR